MKVIMTVLTSVIILQSCAAQKKVQVAERIFSLFEEYSKKITEGDIRKSANQNRSLPERLSVAVYFKKPDAGLKSPQDWKWSQKEKDQLLKSVSTNAKKIKKVFEMINPGVVGEDVKSLRLLAAQQGADVLLLIQGISEVETDANGLAFSYLALLPAFFVNGSHVEGSFTSQAFLWNVDGPFIHLGIQSEGTYAHERPLAFRQTSRVITKSKEESLAGLSQKLQSELTRF